MLHINEALKVFHNISVLFSTFSKFTKFRSGPFLSVSNCSKSKSSISEFHTLTRFLSQKKSAWFSCRKTFAARVRILDFFGGKPRNLSLEKIWYVRKKGRGNRSNFKNNENGAENGSKMKIMACFVQLLVNV